MIWRPSGKTAGTGSVKASIDNIGEAKMLVRKRRQKETSMVSPASEAGVGTEVGPEAAMREGSGVSQHSSLSSEFRLHSSAGHSNITITNQVRTAAKLQNSPCF